MKFKIIFPVFVTSIVLYACNSNSTLSNDAATEMPDTTTVTTAMVIKGQVIFGQKCAACHGSDGTAGIGNAADLKVSKLDSISIVKTITDGKGAMPPFAAQLTREAISDITHYVVALRQ